MKTIAPVAPFLVWLCAVLLTAEAARAELTPAGILADMQRVADWQPTNGPDKGPHGWVEAVADAGYSALAGISGEARYRDQLRAQSEKNQWLLRGLLYHADDHCVGQMYAELYQIYREPRMLDTMRQHFDYVLTHPSGVTNLSMAQPHAFVQKRWSWCDALFMAPPAWLRLWAVTGAKEYRDFAMTNFWATSEYLYDRDEHLYYRDSRYFTMQEANGKKVFWSRGNGWVLAGMARMLEYLPNNDPDRPRLEAHFREMAGRILSLQQPDGSWHSSLLDPDSFPTPEASGTGLDTFALAWGVNAGLLDRATTEPAVLRAWEKLTGWIAPDGKLTHVQPVGADPKKFSPEATDRYGVGAFLLAGAELYRMRLLEQPDVKPVKITVTNPGGFWRENETVEVKLPGNLAVLDTRRARIVDSQCYSAEGTGAPDTLVFQTDLQPGETQVFQVIDAARLPARPQPVVKTFAREVPERFDDVAWESDRIAHRTYGIPLIKAEGTVSSGPDVWIKKNRDLVVNKMYASKHYHVDNGDEMDDYRVGKSRGCGGLGVWDGKRLYVSSNWRHYRLITTGPVRSEFELTYDAWPVGGGRKVSEVRRIRIDAGSWFSQMHTTLTSDDPSPLTIGVGLAERACGTGGEEQIAQDLEEGWLTYWQPQDGTKGTTAVAILLPKGTVTAFTNDAPDLADAKIHEDIPLPTVEGSPAMRNLLAITQVQPGQPFEYYFGASWDRSKDFTNRTQWEAYVRRLAERRDQPLQITVEK